ncbi:MAG: hypothetical protein R6V04_15670 [bacterium]
MEYKAHIYSLRISPLFVWILKAEKNNLRSLVRKTDKVAKDTAHNAGFEKIAEVYSLMQCQYSEKP